MGETFKKASMPELLFSYSLLTCNNRPTICSTSI